MTNTTVPTDEEIAKLYAEETGFHLDDSPAALLDFARAILARWGAPAPASDDLASALGECRDAFSMPPLGSKLELAWQEAIADPLAVPAYVQACLVALPAPEVLVPLSDEQVDELASPYLLRMFGSIKIFKEVMRGFARTIERAHGITAKEPT